MAIDDTLNICDWDLDQEVSISSLGARSDTARTMHLYDYALGDCPLWSYQCGFNDLVLSCGHHTEHWTILNGDALTGYSVRLQISDETGCWGEQLHIDPL